MSTEAASPIIHIDTLPDAPGQLLPLVPIRALLQETMIGIVRPETLQNNLQLLGQPEQLRRLIVELLEDADAVMANAAISEHHDLGFDKLVLVSGTNGHQLRLHLYGKDTREVKPEGVHNHKFDFGSYILYGRLDSEIFHRHQGGKPLHEYVAMPSIDAQVEAFDYRGMAELIRVHALSFEQGTIYTMSHGVIHRVCSVDATRPTATLFLRTAAMQASDSIFTRDLLTNAREVKRSLFTTAEYRRVLIEFLENLPE